MEGSSAVKTGCGSSRLMTRLSPGQPQKDEEPIFDAPWQARTFAMAVTLHEAGLFTWQEWSERLSESIVERGGDRPIVHSEDYYEAWQSTLESLIRERVGQ